MESTPAAEGEKPEKTAEDYEIEVRGTTDEAKYMQLPQFQIISQKREIDRQGTEYVRLKEKSGTQGGNLAMIHMSSS